MTVRNPRHGGLHRRDVLKGLTLGAGAALLSPLLSTLARAQTSGDMPRRFVFVLEGNCAEPVNFLADNARAALDAATGQSVGTNRWFYGQYNGLDSVLEVPGTDFASAPGLASVLDTGSGMSLESDAAVVLGLSSKISGGGHSTHHGALSCTRSSSASPGGQTIDAYLSALPAVRGTSPFDALRVGISGATGQPLNYETCAYARGKAAGILLSPDTAFNSLFGSVASPGGQATFAQRSSLLDFAKDDIEASLSTFSGSSTEREKLETYLAAVEKLSARQQTLIDLEQQAGALTAVKPANPDVNPLVLSGNPLDTLRAQFEIVEAALKGGLTNVAVIASGTGAAHFGVRYASVSNVGRHDLHHGSAGNATYLAAIHEVTRQHIEMVTTLAKNLKATPEPGQSGSMLDHTCIVFMGDNGEQHHSTASDWPMLLLGGSALGLTTGGRTLVFPGLNQPGHRQVSNVFNTFGYCAGQALDEFGAEGPTRMAAGPLSELYG